MFGTKLRNALPSPPSFAFMASMPPTARTAANPKTITIPILTTNWNRSVTKTPQSPESAEMKEVRAMIPTTTQSASALEIPSTIPRIFTMARFTQPRMMQFITTPR